MINKSAFRIVMTEGDEYNRAVAIYHLVLVYERRIETMNIEMSAIIANVLSLVVILTLIVSVAVLRRQLRIQTYQGVQQNLSTIGMCLIDYPELRKYVNENVPLPEPEHKDYDRAHGMIEMLLDFYEHVLEQKAGMMQQKRLWDSWKCNMKFVYETCPGMQDHMLRHKRRYSPALVAILTQKDA